MDQDEPSAEFARWVPRRAHPTPEHYLPLPIAAGAAEADEAEVLEGGMTHGVLSMDSFVFGRRTHA